MKIEQAWIDDPLERGVFETPELCVEVDELPDVTIPPESYVFDNNNPMVWAIGKDGPFVAYEVLSMRTGEPPRGALQAQAGTFNRLFGNLLPPIVDISLFVGSDTSSYHYALPLKRARQLVRKHAPEWRLLLSDRAAQEGIFLWVPVEVDPHCKWNEGLSSTCGKPVHNFVLIKGVDVPLCQQHFNQHQAKFMAQRAATR